MGVIGNWLRRIGGQISSSGRASRLAAGMLAMLVVVGAVWLVGSPSRGPASPAPAASVPLAKRSLAPTLLDPAAAPTDLPEFSDDGDLWRTEAQSAKRSQIAKMRLLSRLITGFPAVRSATVIFEPGKGRSLSSQAVIATAAVKVTLEDNVRMTEPLVAAIVDLVSGGIASMKRENVCVIDNAGGSYRIDQAIVQPVETSTEAMAKIEADGAQKIRSSLS